MPQEREVISGMGDNVNKRSSMMGPWGGGLSQLNLCPRLRS